MSFIIDIKQLKNLTIEEIKEYIFIQKLIFGDVIISLSGEELQELSNEYPDLYKSTAKNFNNPVYQEYVKEYDELLKIKE